ncbi:MULTISPECIES: PdaC/SigV domain-containing protein [unclassified Paenibacillus]|uniref:PdaC/SigV domain-containing protein n=1 Tax=unclassified Paenibacillus TaxID=185978 RepID=UPI0030FCEEB7
MSGGQAAKAISASAIKPQVAAAVSPYAPVLTTFNIEGKQLKALAYSADGTLLVQLMPIARAMGYTVDNHASTGDLTLSKPRRVIKLTLYNSSYSVNGLTSSAKIPFVREGSTYVPLRQLATMSGYDIVLKGKNSYLLNSRPENELTISASGELAVTTEPYSFSIRYPVLSGSANKEGIDKINHFLQNKAEGWKTQAEQELAQAWAAHPSKDKIIDYAHILPYGLQVEWTIAYNEKGLLSLYADTYQYMGESKQDKSIRYSWTFDLATGEELSLQQVAGNNPNYQTRINQYVNLRIASGEAGPFAPLQFPGIENSSTGWYLLDGRVVVYVQQDAAKFIHDGIFEIRIPLSRISEIEN